LPAARGSIRLPRTERNAGGMARRCPALTKCYLQDSLSRHFIHPGRFRLAVCYACDNSVYHVHLDSPARPPLPPSNTPRQAGRLPSTMVALAAMTAGEGIT
jgi:hypothetical protein